jgi:hypothetical protein
MIKYLVQMNTSLIQNLIRDTVRTDNYQIENDSSDHEDYIDRKTNKINRTLSKISFKQLNNPTNPLIIYSNYRKLFNKTLEKYYKEQVCLYSSILSLSTHLFRSNVVMISMKFINH